MCFLHNYHSRYESELSREGELDGEAEVVGGGGIARRGEQRGVGLGVVVGREGE